MFCWVMSDITYMYMLVLNIRHAVLNKQLLQFGFRKFVLMLCSLYHLGDLTCIVLHV